MTSYRKPKQKTKRKTTDEKTKRLRKTYDKNQRKTNDKK